MTISTVAQFAIHHIQLLKTDGTLAAEAPDFLNNTELLLSLYRNMLKARLFDKKAVSLQRTGKMGTYAPIHGQEAISTAIGKALEKKDVLVPYYRDYAAQFQRGVAMEEIFAYWGGDERGSQFAAQAEDLPIAVPIASQCLHAAGIAFAFQYRKESRVALVCLGDGGTSEGDFYEAINVAGAWNLPVVFVVNNNQWAISVPLAKQTAAKTIAQKAIAAGIEGIQVDGNDVLACYQVIGNAIEKARRAEGPTLVEALSYRLCDHTTADDASRYQPEPEVKAAASHEPIQRFRQFLINQGYWSQEAEAKLEAELNAEIQSAVDRYLSRPPQPLSAIFDYHYASLPDYLLEQKAIALEEEQHA